VGKRKLTAEDIFNISLLGDIAQHPTDHAVAAVVTRMNPDDNKYHSHIWKIHTDSGVAVQFTASDQSESAPAWSPDGKWLAFLSNRGGEHHQLYVMPAGGGEAVAVTQMHTDVQSFRWSPNGKSIAFVANVKQWEADEQAARSRKEADKTPRERFTEDVKVITRTWYRLDGVGYFDDRRNHLYVVNVEPLVAARTRAFDAGQPISADRFPCARLTEGPFDVGDFDWSPDGERIVFASNAEPDADLSMERYLYVVDVEVPAADNAVSPRSVSQIVRLPNQPRMAEQPAISPNGRYIAFYGHNIEHGGYTQSAVWVYDLAEEEAKCLTAHLDEAFGDVSLSDTRAKHHTGLAWSSDGKYVFSLLSHRGTTQLVRISATTGECEWLTSGDHCILAYSLNRESSAVSLVRATATDPCNLYTLEMPRSGGHRPELRQLTRMNEEFFREVEILSPEKFAWTAPDGLVLDGWALLPSSEPPASGYPTVVQVHGGPMMMYGESFFFEFQLLAASGIAVIYSNPRGSMGYGQDFCATIRAQWGQLDFADLEMFVDAAMARYPLAKDNVAIAGGSYGGFMAAWAIGHTDRYKAAVVMRSCVNEYSMFGTCDVGFADLHDFGAAPWEQPERYLAMSPIAAAGNIQAHVLILHSENDLRCPIEQAEQLYMALRVRNVPVEFVRFPNESHGMSRSGQPWHRVFRLEKIQSFLVRELSVQTEP
jgi:dipeptidyl aminopeptidase/acylaminoacyl peptidase